MHKLYRLSALFLVTSLLVGYLCLKLETPSKKEAPTYSSSIDSTTPSINTREESQVKSEQNETQSIAQFHEYSDVEILSALNDPDYGEDIASYYLEQLELVNKGSGAAAYELYKLFLMCPYREVDVTNLDSLKEKARDSLIPYLDDGFLTLDGLEIYSERAANCIDMLAVADPYDTPWHVVAAELGFPHSVRRKALAEDYSRENFERFTGAALIDGNLNAIKDMSKFYENVVGDEHLGRAWRHVACTKHSKCDHELHEQFIRDQYFQYEAESILSEARKLTTLIETGEVNDFDFLYRINTAIPPVDPNTLFEYTLTIEGGKFKRVPKS